MKNLSCSYVEGKYKKSGIFNNALKSLAESLGGESALKESRAVCHGK